MNAARWWLLLEGLVPLFGAGFVFCVVGWISWAVTSDKSKFQYRYGLAFDPYGWLYGSMVIAIHAGIKSLSLPEPSLHLWLFGGAGVCALFVLFAMLERGKAPLDNPWVAPKSLAIFTVLLMIAILAGGYRVYSNLPGGNP